MSYSIQRRELGVWRNSITRDEIIEILLQSPGITVEYASMPDDQLLAAFREALDNDDFVYDFATEWIARGGKEDYEVAWTVGPVADKP